MNSQYKWIATTFSALIAMPVFAQSFTDMAKITQVAPRYETVNTPQQQCQTMQESVPQERSVTGAILGVLALYCLGEHWIPMMHNGTY